jgi:hypothetical protein
VRIALPQASPGLYVTASLDLNGPSIRLETIVTEEVATAIFDMLSAKYFNNYATVAWITAAQVARPDRF